MTPNQYHRREAVAITTACVCERFSSTTEPQRKLKNKNAIQIVRGALATRVTLGSDSMISTSAVRRWREESKKAEVRIKSILFLGVIIRSVPYLITSPESDFLNSSFFLPSYFFSFSVSQWPILFLFVSIRVNSWLFLHSTRPLTNIEQSRPSSQLQRVQLE